MHEHVFIVSPEAAQDYPDVTGWDEQKMMTEAVPRLAALKTAGFDSLVDLTVLGMGRDVRRVRQVAEQAGVNIVVATGLYAIHEVPWFLFRFGRNAVGKTEPMVSMFIDDIINGIGGTGIRAGILKCATDAGGRTTGAERTLRAVAQAHRATGVPITTHSHPASRNGLFQQDIFESENVDLRRVVIGHSGDTTDLDYLRQLLDRGSSVGMDRFGMDRGPYPSFDERVATVARLCELGYTGQVVLSHDASCWSDWLPDDYRPGSASELPNWHFLHIPRDVIPALRRAGVSDQDIDEMTIHAPRRILATSTPY
jgi:phosphotriesterase-related protein